MRAARGPAGAARACIEAAVRAARHLDRDAREVVLFTLGAQVRPVDDPEVRTACLRHEGGGRYSVAVDPAFLEKYVRSDEDALWVVLHELLHRAQGHLHALYDTRLTPLGANLLCDILVNRELERTVFAEGSAVTARFYDPLKFPVNLLLPPMALGRGLAGAGVPGAASLVGTLAALAQLGEDEARAARVQSALEEGFRLSGCHHPRRAAALYRRAWIDGANEDEVVERFVELFDEEFPDLELLAALLELLGGAQGRPGGCEDFESPDLDDPGARLGAALGGTRGGSGAGASSAERRAQVALEEAEARRRKRAFQTALLRALDVDLKRPLRRQGQLEARGVVPGRGRVETVLLGAGWPPSFYPRLVEGPTTVEEQAHVYVDVSGSTEDVQPVLFGLISVASDWIGRPVHLFSNLVRPATLEQIRRGESCTTGGTDFDCVVEHAVKNRYRRILIITDGDACLDPASVRAARAARLKVVGALIGAHRSRRSLERLGAEILEVPRDRGSGRDDNDIPF